MRQAAIASGNELRDDIMVGVDVHDPPYSRNFGALTLRAVALADLEASFESTPLPAKR